MLPNFGEIIRKRRKELGLTIEQLAEKADVSDGLISLLERKRLKDIKISNLQKISKALDIEISSFFSHPIIFSNETLDINHELLKLSKSQRKKATQLILDMLKLINNQNYN